VKTLASALLGALALSSANTSFAKYLASYPMMLGGFPFGGWNVVEDSCLKVYRIHFPDTAYAWLYILPALMVFGLWLVAYKRLQEKQLKQITVEFRDKQSIYLQIADHICEGILQGKWKEGERIPSVRELAVLMQVNPHTILRSYDFLLNQDIIFNKRGLGYSASHSSKALITAYRKQRFMEIELPTFFSSLVLLDITIEEIKVCFNEFILKNNSVSH